MAKKKSSKISVSNLLYCAALVLGVVAVCMIFVAAFSVKRPLLTDTFTGLQAVFGYKSGDFTYLGFSFMNLLTYILLLAAVIFAVLKLCGVVKGKAFNFVVAALFIVAGVFFFITPNFAAYGETYKTYVDAVGSSVALGAGSIVAAITSICAGSLALVSSFVKK